MIRVVGRVEFVLGLVDDRLRLRRGRVADAEGGVVGHRHLLGLLAEHVLEVARPLAELHVDDHIGTVLQLRDRLREVVAGGRERGRVDRELLAFVLLRGAPDDEHVERLDASPPPPPYGGGAAGDQLRLVGVVVKHLPDAVQVELRERPRHRLRDTVADRIRVSDTLPLDDLDLLVLDRARRSRRLT